MSSLQSQSISLSNNWELNEGDCRYVSPWGGILVDMLVSEDVGMKVAGKRVMDKMYQEESISKYNNE